MGLTREQLDIIIATAPAVKEHSLAITGAFYPKMFAENPEVFQFFNKANQTTGRQPRALADALVAYALNIERLEALGSAVNRMVHKHVALQVPPEGYAIVGKHLMWAIHEVLGDAVTPDVHDAWVAAYMQLAGILQEAEASLYQEQKKAPGGWEGFRSFTIESLDRTSSGIARLVLRATDGKPISTAKAGQYVSVRFPASVIEGHEGEEHVAPRHYSIVSQDDHKITLCIRQVEGGAISNHIHSKCAVGSTMDITAPVGCFGLDADADPNSPAVFVAGGIGFTPLLPMAREAAKSGKTVHWVHSIGSDEDLKFCDIPFDSIVINTQKRKRLSAEELLGVCKPVSDGPAPHYYFCGPPCMVQELARGLMGRGVERSHLHYEIFGPHLEL